MGCKGWLRGILLLLPLSFDADAATVTWRSDSVMMYLTNAPTGLTRGPVTAIITSSAQHRVLPPVGSEGHWKLSVAGVNTSCLSWHALEYHVEAAVSSIASAVGRVSVVSAGNSYSSNSSYGNVREITFSNWTADAGSLEVYYGTGHCGAVATWGSWENGENWEGGEVPSANDEVVIPLDSGYVALERSRAIQSLTLQSGAISTMESECPTDWSKPQAASFGTTSAPSKCYSVFGGGTGGRARGPGREELNFPEAQAMCRTAQLQTWCGPRRGQRTNW